MGPVIQGPPTKAPVPGAPTARARRPELLLLAFMPAIRVTSFPGRVGPIMVAHAPPVVSRSTVGTDPARFRFAPGQTVGRMGP